MKIAVNNSGNNVKVENAKKGEKYYCVNKDCHQELILCAFESIKRKPYFRVKEKHSENCPYEFLGEVKDYNNKEINVDEFFSNISKAESKKNKNIKKEKKKEPILKQNIANVPRTLKQMYKYLTTLDPNEEINGKKVIDIIAYCGTEYYYKYGIRDKKIVESKLIYIDKNNKELKFQFPIYKYVKDENNKKNKYIIVKVEYNIEWDEYKLNENYIICGDFKDNKMIAYNRRQIKLIRGER